MTDHFKNVAILHNSKVLSTSPEWLVGPTQFQIKQLGSMECYYVGAGDDDRN